MIESRIIIPLTLTSNSGIVTFTTDDIRTRCASNCGGFLCHTEGSPIYKLRKPGIYDIKLTANVTSATAGVLSLGIQEDGVPIAEGSQTIATAGDLANISVQKAVKVCCNSSSTISIASIPSVLAGNPLVATETQIPIISNAVLTITKRA